eukprot:Skav208649  [mRNA]  locus=scaffold1081:309605:310198:- [translate_table: standard]
MFRFQWEQVGGRVKLVEELPKAFRSSEDTAPGAQGSTADHPWLTTLPFSAEETCAHTEMQEDLRAHEMTMETKRRKQMEEQRKQRARAAKEQLDVPCAAAG